MCHELPQLQRTLAAGERLLLSCFLLSALFSFICRYSVHLVKQLRSGAGL